MMLKLKNAPKLIKAIETFPDSLFNIFKNSIQQSGMNQYDHFRATVLSTYPVDGIEGDGEMDKLIPVGIVWMKEKKQRK